MLDEKVVPTEVGAGTGGVESFRLEPWHIAVAIYLTFMALLVLVFLLFSGMVDNGDPIPLLKEGLVACLVFTGAYAVLFSPLWFMRKTKFKWLALLVCIIVGIVLTVATDLPLYIVFGT